MRNLGLINTGRSGGEGSNEEHKVAIKARSNIDSNEKGRYNQAETGSNYIGFSDGVDDEELFNILESNASILIFIDRLPLMRASDMQEKIEEDFGLFLGPPHEAL